MAEERLSIGGQAVIEGVMMRNKANVAVAVRQEKGNIFVHKTQFHSIGERYPFLKWPLFRGVVAFVEALVLGTVLLPYLPSRFWKARRRSSRAGSSP